MKRSKIFLAATSCLLAIAGIAATKAHRTFPTAYYFSNGTSGTCVAYNSNVCIPTSKQGAVQCTLGNTGHYNLYTKFSSITSCVNLLKYTKTGL